MNKLEELWKTKPSAGVDDLDEKAGPEDGAAQPVALKYDDSAQYQVGRVGSGRVGWAALDPLLMQERACPAGRPVTPALGPSEVFALATRRLIAVVVPSWAQSHRGVVPPLILSTPPFQL